MNCYFANHIIFQSISKLPKWFNLLFSEKLFSDVLKGAVQDYPQLVHLNHELLSMLRIACPVFSGSSSFQYMNSIFFPFKYSSKNFSLFRLAHSYNKPIHFISLLIIQNKGRVITFLAKQRFSPQVQMQDYFLSLLLNGSL